MIPAPIDRILVVVPARDEAASIVACVESIAAASGALATRDPGVALRLIVVADACVDRTAALAREAGAEVVEIAAASVGAARRAGIEHGLSGATATEVAATWVAMTDADSTVPRSWIVDQLAAARAGADLLVGRVVPEAAHLSRSALAAWHAAHDALPAGASVHGANLGVRAAALEQVGGIAPMRLHEDVDLVARLRAAGAVVDDRRRPPVRTSARTRSHVEGGFATYLAGLQ